MMIVIFTTSINIQEHDHHSLLLQLQFLYLRRCASLSDAGERHHPHHQIIVIIITTIIKMIVIIIIMMLMMKACGQSPPTASYFES